MTKRHTHCARIYRRPSDENEIQAFTFTQGNSISELLWINHSLQMLRKGWATWFGTSPFEMHQWPIFGVLNLVPHKGAIRINTDALIHELS